MFKLFAGPSGGLAAEGVESLQAAAEGNIPRALQKLPAPKFITDALKSTTRWSEGERFGQTKVYWWEIPINIWGVRTARQGEQGRQAGVSIRQRRATEKTAKQYRREWARAETRAEREAMAARNKEFNDNLPSKMWYYRVPVNPR